MPGIVLLLNQHNNDQLLKLYKKINTVLKQDILAVNSVPHIALMRIQRDFTKHTLHTIESKTKTMNVKNIPIKLRSVGIFKKSDTKFVLSFKPVYDQHLKRIHTLVWDALGKDMDLLEKNYYSPSHFVPHITIPISDPTRPNVMKVCNVLLQYNVNMDLMVDKLSFTNTSKKTGEQKVGFHQL